MLNKTINKVIFILIIAFYIFSLMIPTTFASSLENIITSADKFLEDGKKDSETTIKSESLRNMSNLVYNILLIIGIIVAVVVGLIIGIQFMMGSASEKAKVKETLVPYCAGCIVLFGSFAIWKLVVTILQSNS